MPRARWRIQGSWAIVDTERRGNIEHFCRYHVGKEDRPGFDPQVECFRRAASMNRHEGRCRWVALPCSALEGDVCAFYLKRKRRR